MKKFLFLIIFSVTLLFANEIGLSTEELAWVKTHKIVNVGTEKDYPPFDFVDDNGQYQGIINDYLKLISDSTGLKFKLVNDYPWSDFIPQLQKGNLDILPMLTYTKEREKVLSFSDSYLSSKQYFFVEKQTKYIKSIEDLKGKTVAIIDGYYTVDIIRKKFPSIKLHLVKGIEEGLNSVLQKKAVAYLDVLATVSFEAQKHSIRNINAIEAKYFEQKNIHMATRKEDNVLRKIINKGISAITINERKNIKDKWFNLSRNEEMKLKKVNVAFGLRRPPFLFDKTGQKGIEIDLVKKVLKSQGYQIGHIHQMRRSKQLDIFETNSDIDIAATVTNTPKEGVYYADFIVFNNKVISRTDDNLKIEKIKDLQNYKFGAFGVAHKFSGKEYYELFNPKNAPKNYREFEEQTEQFGHFFSKDLEVIFGDTTIFNYYKNLFKNKYKTDIPYTYHKIFPGVAQRYIAFRDKKVRDDFEVGFKKLKESGEYDRIVKSYDGIDIDFQLKLTRILASISSLYILNDDKKTLEKIVKPFYDLPFIEGMRFIDYETESIFFEEYKSKIPKNYEEIQKVEQLAFLNKNGQSLNAGKVILYFNEKVKNGKMRLPPISKFDNFPPSEIQRIEDLYMENLLIESKEKIELTKEEKEWLKNNPVIKVHNQKTWRPLNFNEDGVAKGFSIDYMNLLASKIGIKVKYVTGDWGELLQKSYDKKLDVMLNIIKTEEREKHLLYLDSYIKNTTSIVIKDDNKEVLDIKSLSGKKVAVIRGYAYEEILIKNYPKIKLVLVESLKESLKAVVYGKADATIGKAIAINYIINDEGIAGLKFAGDFNIDSDDSSLLHVAVRNDAPELHSILEKAMKSIDTVEVNKLKQKWLSKTSKLKVFEQSLKDSRQASLQEILSINDMLYFVVILFFLIYLIYRYYSKSRFLNTKLNKFIFIIILFELIVILLIIYSLVVLDRTENRLEEISENKFNLVQTTNEIKQNSEDLEKYAMKYVMTKNLKYKKIHKDILDIKNGKKPRPMFYGSVYWGLNENIREEYTLNSKNISMRDKIKKLPFTKEETSWLKLSEKYTDDLITLDEQSFFELESNHQKNAINILHSQKYNELQELIMEPLAGVLVSIHNRSDKTLEILEKKINLQFFYILLGSLFFILGNIIIYFMLNKKLIIPIRYLRNAMFSFKQGEKSTEQKSFYNDEIGEMNKEFFSMKGVIEESFKNLKVTQEKLVQREKMASLGSLVAGVAHEINTPVGISLTGITHFEYITKRLKTDYEKNNLSRKEFVEYINDSLEIAEAVKESLIKAVEQIQSFKRVAVDQSSDKLRNMDLEEYIHNTLLSLHSKLKTTKHSVNIHCASDLKVRCYPGAISQIITNFIINSLVHGFKDIESGNIDIYAKKVDNEIEIIYKDNGKGIQKSNLMKVFDPFFTTNREGGGSGLGLHIVYNIVKSQLKGDIELKSDIGSGVEFKIRFPIVENNNSLKN